MYQITHSYNENNKPQFQTEIRIYDINGRDLYFLIKSVYKTR
jgi:hypothetical protein